MYIFQYTYLYTACADDTTFFWKIKTLKRLMEKFSTFSQYFCLKSNNEKYEIAGFGVLKSVKVAVCGMKCVDLCKDTIRIAGVHFSYNKTKQHWEKSLGNNIKNLQCFKNMEDAEPYSWR